MRKFIRNYNLFIIAIFLLLGFSLLYFLYFRIRNQAEVYVSVSVARGQNMQINAVYNWIPNWLDGSIHIGDKEISPLGGLNAEVLDKESYEAQYYGKYTYLLLRVNAIKDRSGIYLFKNKPLSVGTAIDLKLSKSQFQGIVTYVGTNPPDYKYKKIMVNVLGKSVDPWAAESIKEVSEIKDKKGKIIAKVIKKKITLAEINVNTATGMTLITYNRTKRDLELTLELEVKEVDNLYFYTETQKVKVDENLYLLFPEVSVNAQIVSVEKVE